MEFRLLGPLRVDQAGVQIPIGAGKLRTLLAELLLRANNAVPADRLTDVMWNGQPPVSWQASLYNHVMRLRRVLGPDGADRVRAVPPGYLIRVEAGELDTQRFLELCESGRTYARTQRWAEASADLTSALGLWYGEPLDNVPNLLAGQHPEIHRLLEARSQAAEGRIDADLRLGRHDEVISELRILVAGQPLSEVFHRQLMLALYRADRQSEALAVFHTLRRTLVEELGVEPSPSVQDLHRRILLGDPGLVAATAAVAVGAAEPPEAVGTPVTAEEGAAGHRGPRHQLPPDTRVFTGRTHELDQLIACAEEVPGGTEAGMVVISAIDGMAGIGKSALAIHAAHRLRGQYPDGQLFIDLHGHTTGLEPLTADDALDWFLRSLDVAPQLIPQSLDERAAFYRHQLADTRTLIVLDNAATTAQVRPLLPGTPGCLVLITSRKRLTGLDDANTVPLDVLPDGEATALLHKLAGAGRIPAGHPAVAELIALCGHLPLAIRIVAARLRHHRVLRVEVVVEQLRDERDRITRLQDDDRDLAAVFESSYAALPVAEQQLFRRLGLTPGPDVDAYAAANLAGIDRRTAERLLESLLDHNLLAQHTVDRYRFHDLIRLYARDLAQRSPDEEQDRADALTRLLDYYQHAAQAADTYLARQTRPVATAVAAKPIAVVPDLRDRAAALAWMRAERDNVLAAIEVAVASGRSAHVIALAGAMAGFLLHEGAWAQADAVHKTAQATAREHGDRLGEANAVHDLGGVQLVSGEAEAAADSHERALTVYRELGNRLGEANAIWSLGEVRYATGDFSSAQEFYDRALAIYEELGDQRGQAIALTELGRALYMGGDHARAARLRDQALAIYQELGDRHGEADILYESGRGRSVTGDFLAALGLFRAALVIFMELGDRRNEANVRWALGRALHICGDCRDAAVLQERALEIFRDLGNRNGEANALWSLGQIKLTVGDFATAADLLERAMVVYRECGNRHGVASARSSLGAVLSAMNEQRAAAVLLERSLAAFRELGQRQGEAATMQRLGQVRLATGEVADAARLLDTALRIYRDVGDRQGEAMVLNNIGALAHRTGQPTEALATYRQALGIAREVRSPLDEARALEGVARATADTEGADAALADLQHAVDLYQRIGAAETAAAHEYLNALRKAPAASAACSHPM